MTKTKMAKQILIVFIKTPSLESGLNQMPPLRLRSKNAWNAAGTPGTEFMMNLSVFTSCAGDRRKGEGINPETQQGDANNLLSR
jgi:hypothetical protein